MRIDEALKIEPHSHEATSGTPPSGAASSRREMLPKASWERSRSRTAAERKQSLCSSKGHRPRGHGLSQDVGRWMTDAERHVQETGARTGRRAVKGLMRRQGFTPGSESRLGQGKLPF